MSRVIYLRSGRMLHLTQGEASWVEYCELKRKREHTERDIRYILADRLRRVRVAQWARRKAVLVNWAGLAGEALALASAFVAIVFLFWAYGQLGYHSTQGEWMPW